MRAEGKQEALGRHRKLAPDTCVRPAIVRLLTTAAVQTLEARAIARAGPGVLMQRAGAAIAREAAHLLRALPAQAQVLVLVGPGNNGADAALAGVLLKAQGHRVLALEALPSRVRDAEGRDALIRSREAGVEWIALAQAEAILCGTASGDAFCGDAWLVLDGLFGIGLRRPIEGAAKRLIEAMNARDPGRMRVLSVDLPSGLNADTGHPIGSVAVRADVTLTLLADKPGLHTGQGERWGGQRLLDSLGPEHDAVAGSIEGDALRALPPSAAEGASCARPAGVLYDRVQARLDRPVRVSDHHKGHFGDVLVIQGAPATQGAARLALLGAQATGAGRLFLGQDSAGPADALHPEFMSRVLETGPSMEPRLGPAGAVVLGCGLGQDERARRCVAQALAHEAALVLDADALNLLARDAPLRTLLTRRRCAAGQTTMRASVITPHPLEAARLLGTSAQAVQEHRLEAAARLAQALGVVVVLKGWGTVIADPEGRWSINASGGPLLAVAGTGDVLAGVIGGLLAQGQSAWQAARLGAWLHGAAADALSAQSDWSAGIGLAASALAPAIRAQINRLGEDQAGTA